MRFLRRCLRSIENRGWRGALANGSSRLTYSLKTLAVGRGPETSLLDESLPAVRLDHLEHHPFDRDNGTETGGHISCADLTSVSLSCLLGTGYAGVPPSTFREALKRLPIRHEDFTFIDIGCGKGRALLVAAEFPFRSLIGVEITVEMSEVSRANVALRPDWKERIRASSFGSE